jgi:hypothetical protein
VELVEEVEEVLVVEDVVEVEVVLVVLVVLVVVVVDVVDEVVDVVTVVVVLTAHSVRIMYQTSHTTHIRWLSRHTHMHIVNGWGEPSPAKAQSNADTVVHIAGIHGYLVCHRSLHKRLLWQ